MEWLRNNNILGIHRSPQSGNNGNGSMLLSTEEECDPQACYDSFKQHWQQALKIIKRNQQLPSQDDVLSVVNHMEQMGALLLYDIKKIDHLHLISTQSNCLLHLVSEDILDKLYDWGIRTGKYVNAVKSEQLKLYEMLICQSRHVLLVHECFFTPLLKILNSCLNEVFPKQMEKLLINLLYQLCIVLMQNTDLVDLFFPKGVQKFVIFTLLIPFIHRDDNVGMQARDSVLLCMALSKKNKHIKVYITDVSNVCALLASGLGGLYSELPQVLHDVVARDWHRLTPDDVNDIKDLGTFVTSLEFANSVAQMAHADIVCQLQEFMYMGFLIPIFGPALLQDDVDEQVAVMAYLELTLRTVTNPGLLLPLLRFLLTVDYDGHRLLDILMQRIQSTHANDQLALVSLALFETLADFNCEDVMLELVFQHLLPCMHVMLSQRKLLFPIDPHCQSAERLLGLAPSCGESWSGQVERESMGRVSWNHYGGHASLLGNYHAYLTDARNKIHACQTACIGWANNYTGTVETHEDEAQTSLPSLGESSGYESLKIKLDDPPVVCVGPFLTILLDKLKDMLSNSFYVNLHLTGLISRLAVYAHPLLRAYLLDHSLILQPNVPSLFQILGSLKQQVDEFLMRQPERHALIQYAKHFLLERETRLVHAKRIALENNSLGLTTSTATTTQEEHIQQPFQRNGPKRRSLTLTQSLSSLSSMFGRRQSQMTDTSIQLTQTTNEDMQVYPKFNDAQRVAICAVLLDEWTKELAALAQEHAINQLVVLLK